MVQSTREVAEAPIGHPGGMDAALKAKWVKALRSGAYEQTQGTLCAEGGFCCLGVLCDLTGRGEWVDVESPHRVGIKRFQYGASLSSSSTQYFPWPFKTEMGLSDEVLDPLMDMNDHGKSFSEIADYIEENL